jgi:carboxyl-terminal processing protease
MPKTPKILLLAASIALVLSVLLGANATGVFAATSDGQDAGAYKQIGVYGEVLRHIQTDYVVDPNIGTVTDGALRGLLESLDSDSSYLTAADYKTYRDSKAGKAQVGVNISKRFGYATIISVVPGSPADKQNLKDGDVIEAIGDRDTRNIPLAIIEMMLEGAPNSQVTLAVVKPGKVDPDKINFTRTMITVPPTQEQMYENNSIVYLKPGILDHDHVQQVEQKLKGLGKNSNRKVLLDLRDVSAGDMGEAARLANFFLSSGTIATLEGQKFPKQTLTAESSKAIDPAGPMVVLVNRGTAGPAELVAGALLDDKRADLVGEHTFGEGTQVKTFPLPDGAALILSVAKYSTPSGKKLEDDGVTPGTMVAGNFDDGDDDSASPAKAPASKGGVQVDDQLTKALDLLKAKSA